ncbi:MAG: hypothetical protein ACI9K2_000637 [Myxococcota bacterium]|jgi:hypothetical protein
MFHVVAIAVLAIPQPPDSLRTTEASRKHVEAVAEWAEAAGALGLPPAAVEQTLLEVLPLWSAALRKVQRPFRPYPAITGAKQSWKMFGQVPTRSARLEIDVRRAGTWEPLYRPQSAEHDWQGRLLRQERMRALSSAFAHRQFRRGLRKLADRLAERARGTVPGDAIRVQMRTVRIPPPRKLRPDGWILGEPYWAEERAL